MSKIHEVCHREVRRTMTDEEAKLREGYLGTIDGYFGEIENCVYLETKGLQVLANFAKSNPVNPILNIQAKLDEITTEQCADVLELLIRKLEKSENRKTESLTYLQLALNYFF